MIDILRQLGIPLAWLTALLAGGYVAKQLATWLLEGRAKLRDEAISREIAYVEEQLSHFYLPLRERLTTLSSMFALTRAWRGEGGYENQALAIASENKDALRNIVVRRIFLPLNYEVERLILDSAKYRLDTDRTNYALLLQHFVLWRALEQAREAGEIHAYDATRTLAFPGEEVERFGATVRELTDRHNRLREKVLLLRSPAATILPARNIGHD